jgi:hypothetical protein
MPRSGSRFEIRNRGGDWEMGRLLGALLKLHQSTGVPWWSFYGGDTPLSANSPKTCRPRRMGRTYMRIPERAAEFFVRGSW